MQYLENFNTVLNASIMIITGIIAIALVTPGEEPEKSLKKVLNFLTKFSRKK